MDTYLIVLGLISLSIIIIWNPNFTEKMTNADLKVTDFHKQKPGHWDINKDKIKTNNPPEQQIQGPKLNLLILNQHQIQH